MKMKIAILSWETHGGSPGLTGRLRVFRQVSSFLAGAGAPDAAIAG
jgi:hypothetical protein